MAEIAGGFCSARQPRSPGHLVITSSSWDIGVIAFVVLFFFIALASYVKALGGVIALFMGCVWGIGGYYGTLHIGFNGYAALAVSILVGLIGIGVHVSGFDYVRDVNRSD